MMLDRSIEEVPPQVAPATAAGEVEGGLGVVVLGAAIDDQPDAFDTELVEDGSGVLPSFVRENAMNACRWYELLVGEILHVETPSSV